MAIPGFTAENILGQPSSQYFATGRVATGVNAVTSQLMGETLGLRHRARCADMCTCCYRSSFLGPCCYYCWHNCTPVFGISPSFGTVVR